jgi:carboxyl-terminal processing protease
MGGLAVAAVAGGLVWVAGSVADLTGFKPNDRQVSLIISQIMQEGHLNRDKQALDDEISKRAFTTFLKTLDPMKMYFEASDVAEFAAHRLNLDDAVKRADLSFAEKVFKRFLARVDQRVALVDELAAQPNDFAIDEEIVTDGDALAWSKSADEMRDRWRKRIKLELLQLKADDRDKAAEKKSKATSGEKAKEQPKSEEPEKYDEQKARERIKRRYHQFGKRMHQTKSDDLLEMFLTSVTSSYDPHTTYMSPTTLATFEMHMRKELEGIGAALQVDDGYTVVQRIVPGGPADKDGRLKPTDRVVGVGQGEAGEVVDVVDMRLSDVVELIRGTKGTVVRLEVLPGGTGARTIYKITRAKVELVDSVARSEIIEAGKRRDGTPFKIGVIDLPDFYMDMEGARRRLPDYRSTTRDVAKILTDFNAKGVDTVVLDLRRNGGGSLKEAVDLTGLFIERGPVVQVKDGRGNIEQYDDPQAGMLWKGPLVVMTSKFSASASEIFAGAIQDYRRGLVVGDHSTHGKGTVQSLLEVGEQIFRLRDAQNLGALKITIQQFYRPSGDSTQLRGVLADVELPSLTTHLEGVSESDLDYPVAFDKVNAGDFQRDGMVTMPMVAELKARSKQRRDASADFTKVEERIRRYLERKEKKRLTLNEEKYLAERALLNPDKEIEKSLADDEPNRPVVKRDYYFNEVLALTTDYLELLGQQQGIDPTRVGRAR